MISTFDGSVYRYYGRGETTLMIATTNAGTDFTVNIRSIVASPDGLGIGTDAVALSAGGHKLEIYAGDVSSVNSGVVLIDGKEVSLYAPETFSGDLIIEMVSVNKYRISAGDGLTIEVRIDGRYVYTTVEADPSVCEDSLGLLGNCNSDPSNDFTIKDSTVLTTSGANATLDQNSIHDVFGKSFQVTQSSSLFTLAPKQDEIPSGTGVYLGGSSFATDKGLCTFSAADVTFEMKFKPKSVSGSSALMSYLNQPDGTTTTVMIRDGKIVVNYGDIYRETSLTVAVDTWYHMSIGWKSSDRLLLIYLVYVDNSNFMDVVSFTELEVNVFRPCGALSTGQWNMDSLDSEKLRWDYDGVIDEVRIWNTKLARAGIVANAWTYVESGALDLANYWRFNEGEGSVVYDSVGDIDMNVVGTGEWSVPQWVTSDAVVTVPGSLDKIAYDVLHDTMYESELTRLTVARTFCESVFERGDITSNCGGVGDAVHDSFVNQCVYDIYTVRNIAASYSTVSAFLDLCRVTTGWMPQWILCEVYGTGCTWKGDNCDVLCVSGTLNASNACMCLDGFWGSECEHRCQSSCAGIPCNKLSGQCECPLNLDPATNCSTCAIGWHGDDCSSARSDIINHDDLTMCLAYGHTSYVMFDGQTFSLDRTSEFLFMKNEDMEVYVLQTKCDSPYTYCVAEVAIQSSTDVIVIRAPEDLNPAHYTVVVNDVPETFDISLQLTEVSLNKYPKNSIKVTNDNGLVVKMTSYANYLSVAVIAPLGDCTSAEGACGSCDNNPDNDFSTTAGPSVGLDNITANIVNTDFADQILQPGIVRFIYTDAIHAAVGDSAGDYCLYFHHTSILSPPISKVINPDSDVVTMETRFKVDSNATSGVLLGYTSTKAFSISTDNTLKLTVDGTVYDLGMEADTEWQYLSVSYNKTSGETTVYHINGEGVITTKTINIGTGLFTDGGSVAVGAQAPFPDDSADTTYPTTFDGHVDEIRIWNRGFSLMDVLQSSQKDAAPTFTDLAAQWSFREGSGDTTSDSVSDITMTLSSDTVTWVVSDAEVTTAPSVSSTAEVPEELKALCVEVIDDVATSCTALGIAIKHSFLMNCFDAAAITPTSDTIVATATEYAYYCTYMLAPAALVGETCSLESSIDLASVCVEDVNCQFGSSRTNKTCACFTGYWGETCDQDCPGGAENPCYGRGLCSETTGDCACEATWNDTSDCTACVDGWSGPDCSEFPLDNDDTNQTTSIPGQEVATVFGQGHVLTFKDALFKLNALGVFYVLHASSGLQVQAKLVSCYDRSVCIEAVAISHGSDTVVVRSGYTSEQQPLVNHNGQSVISGNAGVFSVGHDSTFVVDVTRDNTLMLAVKQVHRYITFTLTVSTDDCSNQVSMLGDCAETASNSVDVTGEIWRVSPENSLFGILDSTASPMGVSNVAVGGGYALRFDSKTWMATDVLDNVFRYMQDTSIELFVKPDSTSGVVVSYGIHSTLCVYLDTTLHVQVSKQLFDTEIELAASEWNKVTVVWDAVNKQLTVYIIKPDGIVRYKSFSVERTDFFTKGGSFAIGRWVQSRDVLARKPVTAGFVGTIDEIRVWKVALAYQLVQQMYKKNMYDKHVDLVAAWKFDEGEGDVVRDLVCSSHLYFVRYSWTSHVPHWSFSDVPLPPAPLKMAQFFATDAAALAAATKCKSVLETSALATECLGATAQRVYTKVCEYDIAASGRLDTSLHIVAAVADVCSQKMAASSWPAQSLCAAYAPGTFPYYAGPTCTDKCYFRSFDTTPDGECRCYNGYYGADCSHTCPGGPMNACSKHGVCEQATGSCTCDSNWAGDATCSKCTLGYIGSDCSIVATATQTSSQRTAAVSVGGHWTLLDGTAMLFRNIGVFTFYKQSSVNLLIEVAQAQCASFDVCVRAVSVDVDGHTLVISGNSGLDPAVVYLDGRKTSVTSTTPVTITAGYQLYRTDVYQYRINGTNGFEVTDRFEVIFDIQEYNLDVHLTTGTCNKIAGLVAAPCTPPVTVDCSTSQCEIASLGLVEYIKRNPSTQQLQIADYGSTYRVTYSNSLLNGVLGENWSLRKAFVFDRTTALSMSLNNVSNDDLMTIEVIFRIDSIELSSVLLSYSTAGETFAVSQVGGRVLIHHDSQTLESDISVDVGVWGMLALGYQKSTQQVTLVYISDPGTINYERHTGFSLGSFPSFGTLVLGAYHGSTDMNLIGAVDRVTIWDRMFSLQDIRYHWQTNIVYGEPSVTYMWTMSEGSGRSTIDSQHATLLYMHPKTTWANSDVVMSQSYPAETYPASPMYVSVTAKEMAKMTCESLYRDSILAQMCGKLNAITSYYYAACLRSVSATGVASNSLDSVLVYASTCQQVLDLPEWPARSLCNAFPKRHFPIWVGTQCDVRCIFGHVDPRSPETCVCDTGYWGTDCSSECPGGATNMCSGHGVCGADGTCRCEEGWQGRLWISL